MLYAVKRTSKRTFVVEQTMKTEKEIRNRIQACLALSNIGLGKIDYLEALEWVLEK